jgi:hypothetical protein
MKTSTKLSLAVFVLAVVMIVVVALTPRAARAAGPWYVAPGGSDGNDCLSAVSPCATINGALDRITPGDTVLVGAGTYTGTGDWSSIVVRINKSVTLVGGWDAGFISQNGNSIIDGQNARRAVYVFGSGVVATLEHFKIQNGATAVGGG